MISHVAAGLIAAERMRRVGRLTLPSPSHFLRAARSRPRTSAAASSSDSVEYERLTPTEHVLRRPGMYIGATSVQPEPLWLCPGDLPTRQGELPRTELREAKYIPGLYKIFDEILVNALDNRQRDPVGTDKISVDIEPATGRTTIRNTGRGIPVRMHETEGLWIPEMIMGSLFSGSNFDDRKKLTVGGRHGFGAKLTNLFSSEFSVTTVDAVEGLRYTQRWANNMSERSDPIIEAVPKGSTTDSTTVSFTPDLSRFGVTKLHADMLGIFRRRVYEAAATAAPARVLLDGNHLRLNGITDLARMYTGRNLKVGVDLALIEKKRWRVGACLSPGGSGFQSVAFVNGVATPRGGTHVHHVASQLLAGLAPALAKALKLPASEAAALTPSRIRPHLMLFIDCAVDNPEFDSQSKEALTTPAASFGGTFTSTGAFVKAVANIDGLREAVAAASEGRDEKLLARRTKVDPSGVNVDVAKLEDAELAGGKRSSECTLILTEGDSAKALAVAGLAVVGRERYGVFPLRGKPLNVRDVSMRRVGDNAELTGLMRALGLTPGASYAGSEVLRSRAAMDGSGSDASLSPDAASAAASSPNAKPSKSSTSRGRKGAAAKGSDANGLRYGRLMLMADQDSDGSHIKGLVISMVHHFWPELLHAGFMQEFQTPLLKVTKLGDGSAVSFFSLKSYEAWRQTLDPAEVKRWRAKYYKGLGTSTAIEAREYFSALDSHRIQLEMGAAAEADGDLIDMAFSKKRADDRKEDLVQYSLANLRRSVPSAVDGLKPSQRKVLYACFAKGLLPSAAEIKVAQLAGFATEVTAYHHGETSMHATIVNMAQDFVGSNNVPLLEPCGQFGTRAEGGADKASARYIFTRLSSLAPLLFPSADAPTLRYEVEDGQTVEPTHYVPILPMLLINGSNGIGTGWSTDCTSYHPLAVLDNVLAHAEGRAMQPMVPWAAGFRGEMEVEYFKKGADGGQGGLRGGGQTPRRLLSRGVARRTADGILISELPLGRWTSDYKEWMQKQMAEGKACWKSYVERHTETSVSFALRSTPAQLTELMDAAKGGDPDAFLVSALQLQTSHTLTNSHAFDADGVLRHFASPLEIIELHAEARLAAYTERKAHLLASFADELQLLESRARFIGMAIRDELPLFKRVPRREVVEALRAAGFAPHLVPASPALRRSASAGKDAIDGGEAVGAAAENAGVDSGAVAAAAGGDGAASDESWVPPNKRFLSGRGNAYDYLLRMPLLSLTEESVAKLEQQLAKKREEVEEVRSTSELALWKRELEALRPALEEYLAQRDARADSNPLIDPTPASKPAKKAKRK